MLGYKRVKCGTQYLRHPLIRKRGPAFGIDGPDAFTSSFDDSAIVRVSGFHRRAKKIDLAKQRFPHRSRRRPGMDEMTRSHGSAIFKIIIVNLTSLKGGKPRHTDDQSNLPCICKEVLNIFPI